MNIIELATLRSYDPTAYRSLACAQRIPLECMDRVDDIREHMENLNSDDDDDREAAYTALYEYGLSFDKETDEDTGETVWCWVLSTGGPHEEFVFHLNADFLPYRIEFKFLDWWDGAKTDLKDDDYDLLWEAYNMLFYDSVIENMRQRFIRNW